MFGRGWEQARATVIASQQMDNKPVYSHGDGTLRRRQEYVLDVQPAGGGAVFRTTVLSPLNVDSMRDLSVGEVVRVLCHAKDKKVKFDTSDPSVSHQAAKSARRERFDEIASAAPGSGPGGADASRAKQVRRGPDLSREALVRQREKLRAQQSGNDEVSLGASANRLNDLQKLADLHDRGVLNDTEFEAEKAKILDSE